MQQKPLGRLLVFLCAGLLFGCKHPNEAAQETAIANEKAHLIYQCDNHFVVNAVYDNQDITTSKVTLTISGVKYHLSQVVSGSGVRYRTLHGLTLAHGLIWHSKGHEAIASTFIVDGQLKEKEDSERVLFSCQINGA